MNVGAGGNIALLRLTILGFCSHAVDFKQSRRLIECGFLVQNFKFLKGQQLGMTNVKLHEVCEESSQLKVQGVSLICLSSSGSAAF